MRTAACTGYGSPVHLERLPVLALPDASEERAQQALAARVQQKVVLHGDYALGCHHVKV